MRFLDRWRRDRRSGNVALIFALVAPMLLLAVGGVIDLSVMAERQMQLQQATDAAAIAGVARNSAGYIYATSKMNSNGPVPDSVSSPNIQSLFYADWGSPSATTKPTIVGVSCGGSTLVCRGLTPLSVVAVQSSIKVTATYHPYFLGVIGIKNVNLQATSQASDNIPAFMNFYMLLDNTPSMGIAATTAGIQTMVNNTPDQCAFACHDTTNANNYYNLAQKLGVNTRIYNVAQASANLLTSAQTTEQQNGIANEFSVAIFDFGTTATDPTAANYMPLSQVFPQQYGSTSSDLKSAATAAATVDLMTVQGQDQYNDEDTTLSSPLNFAAQYLTASGTGASASSPQQVLFFVSDGLSDTYNCSNSNVGNCRQIVPIDPTPCQTLKSHGVKIAVLYTVYLPLPTNSFWTSYVKPFTGLNPPSNDQIAANMQQCASPGLYFAVNSDQDINAAMNAMFNAVIAQVRITN